MKVPTIGSPARGGVAVDLRIKVSRSQCDRYLIRRPSASSSSGAENRMI